MKMARKYIDETETRTFEVYGMQIEITARQQGWETLGNLSGSMDDAEEPDQEIEETFVGLRVRACRGALGREWSDHSHSLDLLRDMENDDMPHFAPFSGAISLGFGALLAMLWNGDPNKSLYPFKEIK
jgi:hypothetical protein